MTHPLQLITIITEGLLKEEISNLLRSHGATGFTITRADGEGSRGTRARDWEGPNLKFESVVDPAVAEAVLEQLAARYFDHYAVIAWIAEVRVLRGEKFSRKPPR
jgi:nitrogen regulatory protein P-II 2